MSPTTRRMFTLATLLVALLILQAAVDVHAQEGCYQDRRISNVCQARAITLYTKGGDDNDDDVITPATSFSTCEAPSDSSPIAEILDSAQCTNNGPCSTLRKCQSSCFANSDCEAVQYQQGTTCAILKLTAAPLQNAVVDGTCRSIVLNWDSQRCARATYANPACGRVLEESFTECKCVAPPTPPPLYCSTSQNAPEQLAEMKRMCLLPQVQPTAPTKQSSRTPTKTPIMVVDPSPTSTLSPTTEPTLEPTPLLTRGEASGFLGLGIEEETFNYIFGTIGGLALIFIIGACRVRRRRRKPPVKLIKGSFFESRSPLFDGASESRGRDVGTGVDYKAVSMLPASTRLGWMAQRLSGFGRGSKGSSSGAMSKSWLWVGLRKKRGKKSETNSKKKKALQEVPSSRFLDSTSDSEAAPVSISPAKQKKEDKKKERKEKKQKAIEEKNKKKNKRKNEIETISTHDKNPSHSSETSQQSEDYPDGRDRMNSDFMDGTLRSTSSFALPESRSTANAVVRGPAAAASGKSRLSTRGGGGGARTIARKIKLRPAASMRQPIVSKALLTPVQTNELREFLRTHDKKITNAIQLEKKLDVLSGRYRRQSLARALFKIYKSVPPSLEQFV